MLAALLCCAFAQAPAKAALTVGIADQNLRPADPLFIWTGIGTVRLIVPWDAGLRPTPELDARLSEARDAGLDMVVAFEHRRGEDCRTRPCVLPTPAELRDAFAAFRARWPWVTAFGAWNEGNHPSQPTAARPEAAAALYQSLASTCPDCRIMAADVVDITGMATWVRAFLAALPEAPRLWGLHNYGDVTSGRTTMTETMLGLVPGDVWITETGGIVRWGRWPYDEERARAGVQRAFAIADAHPDRIPRLYLYQWRTAPDEIWDSGLLRPDGTPRPGFSVLAARLRPDQPGPPLVLPDAPGSAAPAPARAGLRIVRSPWLARDGVMRTRVACARGHVTACEAVLAVRRSRTGHRVASDRRWIAAGDRRTLRARVPARVRRRTTRLFAEVREPGRAPVRTVVRVRR
jgi:hypothetical protein